ncbi:histidine kinase [Mucilaginibacter myungsuensis]|uniref:Histidine kinase n=2 Tax=Mucilaginibacter myungsuensis TaxID=649104 RepID=A0A929KTA1_9SPHI|nr:histidine kinase [Mucilaginibacter myungsuensis]
MWAACLITVSTYCSFLILNYWVWPQYVQKKRYWEAVGLTVILAFLASLTYMVYFSYKYNWIRKIEDDPNRFFLQQGCSMALAFLMFYIVYVIVREIVAYQHRSALNTSDLSSRITREIMLVFGLWFGGMMLLLVFQHTGLFRVILGFYFFFLPYAFIVYFVNLYWLIPAYKQGRIQSSLLYFFAVLAVCVSFGIIEVAFLLQTYRLPFMGYVLFYWVIPTPLIIGLTWRVYLNNEATYQQLQKLKTALGTSDANLQYLRAQINPHFLFNALNTLYGTALLEKAEKTGEGIQKLGDMMRFMLHENNMDKIALSRELDYIHNYIDLQNMRLALSPEMNIDIQIEDIIGYYEIAPMLLIPFIENAYKHGISHQNKSWINVNLYKRDNILHLDVHNSMHPYNENDPERDRSGTGLNNVKQRLQLSYPDKHELVVRENGKEFFIHLSIELTIIKTL